ncbi:ankyrin repeat domain-containing protein SOWAHC-like isoform X1 [Cololabis saira]|uniref:ankyrin repeat domain-containing protein SOWAHC-like isoform X1 n=1 Tax=Cololabis saira TaxID=129043 RepID=UPI002AD4164E|nr:ankyrin repeat domain-containing protein SOWAHC-like isoform X1 [Cololabis saira]
MELLKFKLLPLHRYCENMKMNYFCEQIIRLCFQGYTALHLASIHGHQDIIQTLISTYNAKTNIRDYHGKMAIQYWSGCTDIFNQPDPQSAERFCRGQRTQRFALPSLRLSRSRSHGQLHLEFGTLPQSGSHDGLDLHV